MSAVVKSEAIALRVEPFSRTSAVSRWLTADHGRLTLLAKGAQRPRSAFIGQFDLFYTCEVVFHTSPGSALCVLRDCAPLQPRLGLREDWQAAACASYLCYLVDQASLPGGDTARLYELLTVSLDYLSAVGGHPLLPFWFELKLTQTLGLAPQLERCTACGAALATGQPQLRLAFAPARGGVVCSPCASGSADPASPLSLDVWAVLRAWQACTSPRQALRTACTPAQNAQISRHLGRFLEYHLEVSNVPRECALLVLNEPRATRRG